MKILKKHILKINELLSYGLVKGVGSPEPGKMCVEAVVTQALGLPFNDSPECVHKEVRKEKIALNDCNWSSNKARAEGMKYIAVAQLGSSCLENEVFKKQLLLRSTQRLLPFLIQEHYDKLAADKKDPKLLEYKQKFESLVELDDKLWKEFYNNYYYHYNYYYNFYYNYYHYNYYYHNYYHYNNNYYHKDEFLLLIADTILQTLKDVKSPGCKYLKWLK